MADVVIIGAGAAGMMAAGRLLERGVTPVVIEHQAYTGRKLGITGKGRCNLTNLCTLNEFMENMTGNPRFMYSAFSAFTPEDCMALFVRLGVPLKVERGNRVFPESDKAADIVGALRRYMAGAELINAHAAGIKLSDGRVSGVQINRPSGMSELIPTERVLLCTGGRSYPVTGSDGSGYELAGRLGHTIIEPYPSLVPLEVSERSDASDAMGLSLKNVRLTLYSSEGKEIFTDFGELMITHFGLSGPLALSASAHIRKYLTNGRTIRAELDLKSALDESMLDRRLLSDFEKYKNKSFSNSLSDLLPHKLIPVVVRRSGIAPERKVNSITKEERRRLVELLKRFSFTITNPRPIAEAIVTSGGVSVREIDPRTMASRLVEGLYFAGELIDVDAYTGGFNLQIAFSTAYAAAEAIADES